MSIFNDISTFFSKRKRMGKKILGMIGSIGKDPLHKQLQRNHAFKRMDNDKTEVIINGKIHVVNLSINECCGLVTNEFGARILLIHLNQL